MKKQTKKGFDRRTLKRVLHDLKRYRLMLLFSLLFAAVNVALTLYIPLLTGDAIDLIVGKGNDYPKLETFIREEKPVNIRLMNYLPKEDYDAMVGACDVGLIFLDHRFTIPNFPSRLLAYMQAKIPVLAATDPNTDIGAVITTGGFGWWCESNDADGFAEKVRTLKQQDFATMKNNGYAYLNEHYSTEKAYSVIMRHFTE